jgi:Flp pilus assembly pilin Flp
MIQDISASLVRCLLRRSGQEDGQALAEYSLILAFVAAALVVALVAFAVALTGLLGRIGAAMP